MEEQNPHILIVDDDPNMTGTISDILIAKGYQPTSALSGGEALTQIEEYKIQVALIDLRLGDMSGMDVLRGIKARSPRTECILLTGHATQNSAIDAVQAGAFGYFQKPFDLEQVLLSIKRAIEKYVAEARLHESEERYRGLFEDSPIAIWEEDFSEVKQHLDSLKQQGVTDFRNYFESHPEALLECISKIKILDVNNAAVQMFRAESKEELIRNTNLAPSKGEQENNHEDFIVITEGKTGNVWEGSDETLNGEPIEISLTWSVVPGYEKDYSKIIVTTLDITERKRTEEALRKNEALLSEAQRIGKIGHWEWVAPETELICSDELFKLFEIPQNGQKISRGTISKLMHPEDLARVTILDRELFAKHLDLDYEYRVILPGSRLLWIHQQAQIFYGVNGQPVRMMGIIQDITERKAVDEAWRRSDAQYRLLANNISDVIWILDIEAMCFTYVSPSVEQLRGVTPSEVLVEELSASLTPDSMALIQKLIPARLAIAQQGIQASYTDEIEQTCKDGSTVWTETSTHFHFNSISGHWEAYGVSRNISERRSAAESLRESDERYQLANQATFNVVWDWDLQTNNIWWNDNFRLLFGYSAGDIESNIDSWMSLIHPRELERVKNSIQSVIDSGGRIWFEQYRRLHKDGFYIDVEDRGIVSRDANGTPKRMIGAMQDITERKLAEDALRESEKRYHDLFEDSPIALREEDFSEVRKHLDLLKQQGVTDFQNHFVLHPELVLELAAKVKVMEVNKAALKMYRADNKDKLPNNLIVASDGKPTDRFRNQLVSIAEGQTKFVWEWMDHTIDGKQIYVEVNWSVDASHEKDLSKVIVSLQDITERKQAADLVRDQTEQLRLLYEASQQLNRTLDLKEIYQAVCDFMSSIAVNDGLFISAFDPETQLITCRAYWMENKWLDVSPFPAIPLEEEDKGAQSRVIRSGQSMLINDYQAFVETVQSGYYVNSETNQIVNNIPPEEEIARSALIVPLKLKGKVSGVIQVMSFRLNDYNETQLKLLDALALHVASAEQNAQLYSQVQAELNERKLVEKSLRENEEQYRTLVEQIPAIVFIDEARVDGSTIYVSPQVETILGFTPQQWMEGSPGLWAKQVHPIDLERIHTRYLQCIQSGVPYDLEYRISASDGRLLWFHDQAIMLRDENGKPKSIHGLMYDITERKQAEEITHQHVLELELLYESGLAFSQLLNPKDIGQKIISLLEQKMNWHHTAIRLYDPQTKILHLLAFNQPSLDVVQALVVEQKLKEKVTRPDQGVSGWAVEHGQIVRSTDLPNDARYVETLSGMQSGLYVPIKLGDHVIGVISIESENPNAFSQADERLTDTLASQAASALENARLFDETHLRIKELTMLHGTSQSLLAARLNTEEIYTAVHQAVAKTMKCDAFVIVLDNEEWSEYHAVYFFDKGQHFSPRRLPRGTGLSGRVISSGETLMIDDTSKENVQATHFGTMESTLSILAVPLRRGNETIGMLSTQSYQPRAYSDSQLALLETIGAQLSSALDNTNLFQQTQARIRELESLYIITTSLRSIQSMEGALSTLLDNTLAALDTSAGEVLLYNQDSNELRGVVAKGWYKELMDFPVKSGTGVAGTVLATGESYYSIEFAREALPQASSRALIPPGWGGVCLPIRISTEAIGVMFISVELPRQINSQQIRLLESLVEIAGVTINRIRLYDAAARRAEEFASLYETSKVLSEEYDLDTLLEVIVEHAREMLNSSTSGMYLYDAKRQVLELKMDNSPERPVGMLLQIGEGLAGKVAQTRQPMRIEDYSIWEGRSPHYEGIPIRAVIEVPMLYAGELIGVLAADEDSNSNRKFTESDERLLSLFASQAAGAINAVRRREETLRYADELEERVIERTAEIDSTRKRLDLAARAGGIGVWEIEIKENKVILDKRMHFILGTDPEEFDNTLEAWWARIYPEDLEQTQKHFAEALKKTGIFSDEHRIIRLDGSLRYTSVNGIVLSDSEYNPERMIGVAVDITDRRQAEEALKLASFEMERAMRTKDEFLANMSHELRTPLNAILGISESLEEQFVGALNDKQLKYTGIIRESGRHLLDLINDILDISKVDAGRLELDLHDYSVEKICQSSLRMIKELAQKKDLSVSFEIKGGVKTILGDERRLKQSLVNLLGNAVKFTPQGGAIGLEVNGYPELSEVTFTIWDTGVGIASEDIQYLFKPFVQLDAGLAREFQGTGLGLALVAQMIHLHGGRVHVESSLGHGSRFIITLPWWSEQQNALLMRATGEIPRVRLTDGKKLSGKILLVEDTNVVITLMSEYLIYKGYKVFIARNGLEGVQIAKEEHPDLILMDVMMPVMDGLEATRRIRADQSLRDVPIIALTALAMADDREHCLAAGMNDYMSKPIRMQELSDVIEKYLGADGASGGKKSSVDN